LCGLAIARRRLHSLPGAKGNSQTALFYASRQGRCEIIQYLMSQGADPNVVDEFGETALLGCAATVVCFGGMVDKNLLNGQGASSLCDCESYR